jgi:hypothetical protein
MVTSELSNLLPAILGLMLGAIALGAAHLTVRQAKRARDAERRKAEGS